MDKVIQYAVNRELEARLCEWAREYGGGAYAGGRGGNIIATLMAHKGFVPSSRGYVPLPALRTPAEDVEDAVMALSRDSFRQACVIRAEYFIHEDEDVRFRLDALRKLWGVSIGRTTYYDELAKAKAFVANRILRNGVLRRTD